MPDVSDETPHWLRQFFWLFLAASLIQFFQAVSGVLLARLVLSPVLLAFGLDAAVGACRELAFAARLGREGKADYASLSKGRVFRILGGGFKGAGLVALVAGAAGLWQGSVPGATLTGVALASVSVLLIPIVGSYMKAVAVELRSPALGAAAVFTFSNSYLSMVLLISQLVRLGMNRWWGDAVGAIVMAPFIIQKGVSLASGHASGEDPSGD
jgi:divalent metal cation (Fe/Co/Zn/Cd) transporter